MRSLVCELCGETSCGPFASVTLDRVGQEPIRLLAGDRCLKARGIRINWGPMYTFRIDPEKSLTPEDPSTIKGTLTRHR